MPKLPPTEYFVISTSPSDPTKRRSRIATSSSSSTSYSWLEGDPPLPVTAPQKFPVLLLLLFILLLHIYTIGGRSMISAGVSRYQSNVGVPSLWLYWRLRGQQYLWFYSYLVPPPSKGILLQYLLLIYELIWGWSSSDVVIFVFYVVYYLFITTAIPFLVFAVLVDVWLFLFSKKVNFMTDLHRKYICRSAVALVETHSLGVNFRSSSVLWWHRVT